MAKKKKKQINLYEVIFGCYFDGDYCGNDNSLKVLAENGEKAIKDVRKNYSASIQKNEFIDEVKLIETNIEL